MANKKYEEANVQAIADAIRDKTGGTEALTLDDMASGVNEVYEAGKKSQYDEFWDSYQSYGNLRYYKNSFSGNAWNNTTFKPKYDIIPTVVMSMFQECFITDLIGCLAKNNVKLDFSEMTSGLNNCFYGCRMTEIPELDCRKANGFSGAFRTSNKIVTIQKIILNEQGTQSFTNTFEGTTNLQNITFEGVIGQNISFSSSPLTVESMKSVITHLKDYSTEAPFTYTLTLKSDRWTLLDAEGNTSPNGNKWRDYVSDKGWLTE